MLSSGFLFWLTIGSVYLICCIGLIRCLRSTKSGGTVNSLIVVLSLLTLFGVAEIGFRMRHYFWRGIPWFSRMTWSDDSELGWAGNLVEIPSASDKKILFLGDSFTAGMGVESQQMYYAVVARALGLSAVAYAAPGYGTLQEALVLNRILEHVRPEVVVLQVCSNDLINNYWGLERASLHQRVLRPRPYLENGKIVQHMPRSGGWLRLFLAQNSRLFHFIFIHEEKLLLRLAKSGMLSSIEDEIARDPNFPPFLEAQAVTGSILERMKQRLGTIPFKAFIVDDVEPARAALQRVFAQAGIELSEAGIHALHEATSREPQVKLRLEDGVHLSAAGNEVLGRALAIELRK